MDFIKDIVEKIYSFDDKKLKSFVIIYICCFFVLLCLLQVFFIFQKNSILANIKKLDETRSSIIGLVDKKNRLEAEKQFVDDLLKKDENFRIKEYVISILTKHNLINNLQGDYDTVRAQPERPGYNELLMSFELHGLTLKQLVNVLIDMESDRKILFKEIILRYDEADKKINLVAVVSTIKSTVNSE
jgi:hypothetical protein